MTLVGHLSFSMNWFLLLRVTLIVRERKRTEDLEGDETKTAKRQKIGNVDKGKFPLFSKTPKNLDC